MNEIDGNPALSRSFHADSGGGTQQLNVELGLGKSAAIILWLSAFVSAAAVVGLFIAVFAYGQMSAHVNVLQYDLAIVKAQLIEQGLYDPTGH